jgi:hypothetical protein
MDAALQQMQNLVSESSLPPEVRQQCLWALNQLPALYAAFARTYDIRHRDGIAGLVQGIINTLAKQPDGQPVSDRLVNQIRDMHERLAIPGLTLKMPAPPKTPRKRKAA